MTTGTVDQMLLHLDDLQTRFSQTSEPTPAQARAATRAFSNAILKTAESVLARSDLLPQQSTKATQVALMTLARRTDSDPASLDKLIELADFVLEKFPKTQAATSAAFVKANVMASAPQSRYGGSEGRLDKLVPALLALGRCDPPQPQALDMLLKLAKETEDVGRTNDALALFRVIAEKFSDNEKAQDAANFIRRFELVGTTLDDFKGKDLEGNPVDLADFRGKVVLIDFWGTWCPPCVASTRDLKRIRSKFDAYGFEILGIVSDPSLEIARAYVKKNAVDWPQISEPVTFEPGSLQYRFGVSFFPTYLIVDRAGKLIGSSNEGYLAEAQLDRFFEREKIQAAGESKKLTEPSRDAKPVESLKSD
jgi:thiol-disulfide isomerase/thioredoxin